MPDAVMIEAPAEQLVAFLDATLAIVPQRSESDLLDLDQLISDILLDA